MTDASGHVRIEDKALTPADLHALKSFFDSQ